MCSCWYAALDSEEDPVAQERQALADQRAALEALKRQLAERIAAVKEREAGAARRDRPRRGRQGSPPSRSRRRSTPTPTGSQPVRRRWPSASVRSPRARPRWRPVRPSARWPRTATPRWRSARRSWRPCARELDARERAIAERERIPPDPDAVRLAEIESRLDELRAAEEAFLRTRRELADHSDAIAAREQLLAQRERELDEREDGWGGPDVRELESRLRRLETQRTALGADAGASAAASAGSNRKAPAGLRRPEPRRSFDRGRGTSPPGGSLGRLGRTPPTDLCASGEHTASSQRNPRSRRLNESQTRPKENR